MRPITNRDSNMEPELQAKMGSEIDGVSTAVDATINPVNLDPPIQAAIDILILSNGPGELATWVRPVVRKLRQKLGDDRDRVRISVVLSPCPNASGCEAEMARSYPEVDRVQGPEAFFNFLLWGKTAENWDWRDRGVVLFLGGDQFFTVVISRRLGYRSVVYAEWEARWLQWIDRVAVMNAQVLQQVPAQYAAKCTVVGDLMADVGQVDVSQADDASTGRVSASSPIKIGLLAGSKPAKLAIGVPLSLAIADSLHQHRPEIQFFIPVAPTLAVETLARFADLAHNPIIAKVGNVAATLLTSGPEAPALQTPSGLIVPLCTEFPAYTQLAQCTLCLTTIGANTAELGALAVPMIVLLPTQQLDAMRAWDGLPGILANLPGIGSLFAKAMNWLALRQLQGPQRRLLAWPNIWAGSEIVPELVGPLEPQAVAHQVLELLNHPDQLTQMRDRLRQVRGQPGAVGKLVDMVVEIVRGKREEGIMRRCGYLALNWLARFKIPFKIQN
ncbi:lipid-A-disaccharide synthase [Trichothermofontia sp.]